MKQEIQLTVDDYHKITRLVGKAIDGGLIKPSQGRTLTMDIEFACKEFNLDLDMLLKFDATFYHDISGIHRNINRETKEFKNCFVPRSARQ